jgi:DNA-binding PadR family transcriptional regulator
MDTSNRNVQLQEGRKALQLAGKSPRQVGQERAKLALRWIYDWGWSTPTAVELLAGGNRSGLATRLVQRGLVNRTRTESGGGHRDVPAYLLTLTEGGVQEVERWLESESSLLPYDIDPYKINQAVLRHDTIAQMATIRALKNDTIQGYMTERQLAQRSESRIKQPDVVWIQKIEDTRLKLAIEVELSAKWARDLDQFVHSCVLALSGDSPRFDQIILITDSPAILTRYKSAFQSGNEYNLWERDQRRHWIATDSAHVPENAANRFLCKLVNRS